MEAEGNAIGFSYEEPRLLAMEDALHRRNTFWVVTLLCAAALAMILAETGHRQVHPSRQSRASATTKPAPTPTPFTAESKANAKVDLASTPWPPIDVTKYMRIHNRDSAEEVRSNIVSFVWPSGRPLSDSLTKQPDTAFPSTELWTLTMKHGIVSRMYFVRAIKDSQCLFLYHAGHSVDPILRPLVERFTSYGCDVVLISMPLYHINADARFKSKSPHDELRVFETPDFSPFAYFIEPVVRAIDEATKQRSYARIGMAGLSGGGWTTAFVGAIEPRIKYLYPVAGSMPFALDVPPEQVGKRNVSSLRGDYEQSHSFYRTVTDYLDLYLLDVYGPGRRAIHFYIERDSCCFLGAASYAFSGQITQLAREITGNSLEFVVDTAAKRHEVSTTTLDAIFADFTGQQSVHRSDAGN